MEIMHKNVFIFSWTKSKDYESYLYRHTVMLRNCRHNVTSAVAPHLYNETEPISSLNIGISPTLQLRASYPLD